MNPLAFFEKTVFISKTKKLNKREMTALVTEVLRYIEHNSNSIQALLSGKGHPRFSGARCFSVSPVCPIRYEKLFGKGCGLRLCGILPGFHPNGILE